MPDLREAFEMVKQQTEPDKDSWAEQERRIRGSERKRKYAAIALVAALLVVIGVVVASNLDADDQGGGFVPATTGPTPGFAPGPSQLTFLDIASGKTTGSGIVPGASEVDVSLDGTKMTYLDGSGAVTVANVDGSDPHPFAQTIAAEDPIAPRWSPDGTEIVFQRQGPEHLIGDLYVLDVTSGQVKQITHVPQVKAGLYYMAPAFSADGQSVLFTMPTQVASGPNSGQLEWDLWTVPASGGDATLLVKNAGLADTQPRGGSIAYVSLQPDGKGDPTLGDLYVARSDGSQARKVADGEALLPRWSPDGSAIAYADMRAVRLFVVNVANGDKEEVWDSDEWPEWVNQQTLIIDLSD